MAFTHEAQSKCDLEMSSIIDLDLEMSSIIDLDLEMCSIIDLPNNNISQQTLQSLYCLLFFPL